MVLEADLYTSRGRRYCEVCYVYIGTNVEAPRCILHANKSVCSWCRKPVYTRPEAPLVSECSVYCGNATTRYDQYLRDKNTHIEKIRGLESRIASLTKALTDRR